MMGVLLPMDLMKKLGMVVVRNDQERADGKIVSGWLGLSLYGEGLGRRGNLYVATTEYSMARDWGHGETAVGLMGL